MVVVLFFYILVGLLARHTVLVRFGTVAAWRFGLYSDCIGTHSVLRHWDAWRYDWASRSLVAFLDTGMSSRHFFYLHVSFLSYFLFCHTWVVCAVLPMQRSASLVVFVMVTACT